MKRFLKRLLGAVGVFFACIGIVAVGFSLLVAYCYLCFQITIAILTPLSHWFHFQVTPDVLGLPLVVVLFGVGGGIAFAIAYWRDN